MILIRTPRVTMAEPGARGGRSMIPGSLGSKARPRPRSTAVIMLIQRICSGSIGSAVPRTMPASSTSPWPTLVGSA